MSEQDQVTRDANAPAEASTQVAAEVGETSLDAVIDRVLDAGEVANRTASIAADSTAHLLEAVGQIRAANESTKLHAVVVLGVTGLLMLVAVGVFFLMARQLHDSLEAADAAVLAVGRRVVQLNSGVEYLKDIQQNVANIEQRLTSQAAAAEKISSRIDSAIADLRKANSELADKLAKPAEMRIPGNLQAQLQSQAQALQQLQAAVTQLKSADHGVKDVGAQLQSHSKSIQKISEQLSQLQGGIGKINAISQTVDSILALEKQKLSQAAPVAPAPQAAPRKERIENQTGVIRYPYTSSGDPAKGAVQSGVGAGAGKSDGAH